MTVGCARAVPGPSMEGPMLTAPMEGPLLCGLMEGPMLSAPMEASMQTRGGLDPGG